MLLGFLRAARGYRSRRAARLRSRRPLVNSKRSLGGYRGRKFK